MTTEEPRLALIAETWHADGTLLGYLSWLDTLEPAGMTAATLNGFIEHVDETPLSKSPTWENRLRLARATEPWNGGSDPLHMWGGVNVAAPSLRHEGQSIPQYRFDAAIKKTRIVGVDHANRTATYVSDTIEGWYAGLFHAGDKLPSRNDGRSWRVEVFVKTIGFLGTYRRSRETGLWFSGGHHLHSIGN